MLPSDQYAAAQQARDRRPPRVVLDSTVVVSALVFGGGAGASLRHAWQQRQCLPLACAATLMHLNAQLAEPRLGLSAQERRQLLNDYLPHTMKLRMPAAQVDAQPLPELMFVRLAMLGRAQAIVTADPELLGLHSPYLCPMLSLDTFIALLQTPHARSKRSPASIPDGQHSA
jgi:predicted nucleic acid-binding protein